ncbi:hypothetical protein JXQ31_14310 [candidate division KSB1 bacterium]|nr:hypothetical protein [candidate division KSB1 bacterium]
MKRKFYTFYFSGLLILLLGSGCGTTVVVTNSMVYNFPNIEDGYDYNIPSIVVLPDNNDYYWTFFTSHYYGFLEYWLAFSKDKKNWSRPLYTGIPATINYIYRVNIDSTNNITISRYFRPSTQSTYTRATVDSLQDTFTVYKSDLFYDLDADGLTDLAEFMLRTDPLNNDTDGDGKSDGYDQNPLAAYRQNLSIHEQLHKFIIESELSLYTSDQLVIVEQINNKPIEYKRSNGIILSMPPDSCDTFINLFGYGVPVLTAAVTDTLKKYKVSFQYFFDPDNAGGYDALFDWDHKFKKWVRKKTYFQWETGY